MVLSLQVYTRSNSFKEIHWKKPPQGSLRHRMQEGKLSKEYQKPKTNSAIDHRRPLQPDKDQTSLAPDVDFSGLQSPAGQVAGLPHHSTTNALRQKAILQLQRTHGNAFVQRHITPTVQRIDEEAAESGGSSGEQEIGGAGSTVRAGAGAVDIEGPMVNINAGSTNINSAMTNMSGVLRVETLIADSVISSSYSPGAGNIM